MSAPTVGVVICAHTQRRWARLLEAVASVLRQSPAPQEIVVVVDGDPALLTRARDTLGPSGVVVAPNAGAPGLSGGRNTGVGLVTSDVVAFLDDDAVADPGWLAALLAGYADERVVGVGGAIAPVWQDGAPAWLPPELLWTVGCTYRGLPESAAPVRNLIGANMSFRRDVVDSVGGFTSDLGRAAGRVLHCEETELCIRVRRAWPAATILYEPRAGVAHHVPPARRSWGYLAERCFTEGLAKALVAELVGTEAGLASERGYLLTTVPRGIARGLADAVVRRDAAGPARSAVLCAGVVATAIGYAVGRFPRRRSRYSKT